MNKLRILILIVLLIPGFAMAATRRTFPGSSPCNTTLQKCINGSNSGDTIQIKAGVVQEDLNIQKSITLAPYPGYEAPIIGGDVTMHTIYVSSAPNQTVKVTLRQLDLQNARAFVSFSGAYSEFNLISSKVELDQPGTNAVDILALKYSNITIAKNDFLSSGYGVHYLAQLPSANNGYLAVESNRFSTLNSAHSAGAVLFQANGSGNVTAFVDSNVIFGVGGCCGPDNAAIFSSVTDAVNATFEARSNTIDGVTVGDGIQIYTDVSNEFDAYIANNIVTNVAGAYLRLPAAYSAQVTIYHDYNTYWNASTADGSYPPGPNTKERNPAYQNLANHDYHLGVLSSEIDQGYDGLMPYADNEDGPRYLGYHTDRGAYEAGASNGAVYSVAFDDFEDGVINPNYNYDIGTWTEDGRHLVGYSKSTAVSMIGPNGGCSSCSLIADVSTAGHRVKGKKNAVSILAWYKNSQNNFELKLNEETDTATLTEKVNGVVVHKQSISMKINPFTDYSVNLYYDGTDVKAIIGHFYLLYFKPSAPPSGEFGFKVYSTYGFLDSLSVSNDF